MTPLPQATPTATPIPPCIDGMAWVADLNLDDKNMTAPPIMQPGQQFTKGWRIRNSGTCDWTTAFRLVYVSGNSPAAQMGGQPVAISRGSSRRHLRCAGQSGGPLQPGTYQGFWQMTNAQGWRSVRRCGSVSPCQHQPPPRRSPHRRRRQTSSSGPTRRRSTRGSVQCCAGT
ncbi:MAG: hypothetical protein HZY76_14010 [Anaerolineae bacterium]|nr:MAG: hypothetical protein HZY76_14010 [Anaerolineae bacterium]